MNIQINQFEVFMGQEEVKHSRYIYTIFTQEQVRLKQIIFIYLKKRTKIKCFCYLTYTHSANWGWVSKQHGLKVMYPALAYESPVSHTRASNRTHGKGLHVNTHHRMESWDEPWICDEKEQWKRKQWTMCPMTISSFQFQQRWPLRWKLKKFFVIIHMTCVLTFTNSIS